jgi:hypothetical protein
MYRIVSSNTSRILLIAGVIGLSGLPAGAQKDDSKPQTPAPASPATGQIDAKPQAKPGRDRWLVKTAADADTLDIKKRPEPSTVEKLLGLPRPKDFTLEATPPQYQEKRAGPVEKTIYTVEADVVECRLMPDGDYRVVIKGAKGETMVLEMPDPNPQFVDPKGPFAYALKSAREIFDSKVKPEKTAKPLELHAKITGLGFFGRAYGKMPAKGNLIQLHPVVDFEWLSKPSEEFDAARKAVEKAPEKK